MFIKEYGNFIRSQWLVHNCIFGSIIEFSSSSLRETTNGDDLRKNVSPPSEVFVSIETTYYW
jgi:hypothetical protein